MKWLFPQVEKFNSPNNWHMSLFSHLRMISIFNQYDSHAAAANKQNGSIEFDIAHSNGKRKYDGAQHDFVVDGWRARLGMETPE